MRRTKIGFTMAIGALACVATTPAMADDAREQQLEQRVRELEAQLSGVMDRLDSGATSDLGTRVAELEAAIAGGDNGMDVWWKNGVHFATPNKRFTFQPFGRIHLDWLIAEDADDDLEGGVRAAQGFTGFGAITPGVDPVSLSDIGGFETGVAFRRARLGMRGTLYDNIGYVAEFDFAGGDADFRNVYMSLKNPCIGMIKVGHFKQPFGGEQLTSSNYLTFMERGLPSEMTPGFETGIGVFNNYGDDMSWGVSTFRNSNSYGDDRPDAVHGDSEWNFAGRVAGRPYHDDDNDEYLHMGGSLGYWQPNNDTVAVGFGGAQAVTGFGSLLTTFSADDAWALGLDAGYVSGPFQFQAEYVRTEWDTIGASDADFDAFQFYVSYFLTGESRPYSAKKANYARLNPASNYADPDASGDGLGAWEVALRYDEIDLDDGGVRLGDADQWTLGLNWYLNPHTRVMLNYAMADIEVAGSDLDGDLDTLAIRFQIDF